MNNGKKEVLSGLFWKFSERMLAQIVSAVVAVVLARILSPSEYGTISLVTVFITIANVFVTSGFGTALIQKKEADNVDFSTIFYFNIIFSLFIYFVLFIGAGFIAAFYKMPILVSVLRVLALSIPIMGINSVQQAYVSREMIFKKFFYSTLGGTLFSGVVGIAMAYMGFGVWALVAQSLTNTLIDTIVLHLTISWRPIKAFSFDRLRSLFDYGWKLLIQSLILNIYASLRSLVIGKVYTTADLAYYTKGCQYPQLICTNIDTAMNSALFPAMSKEQSSIERVKSMARRTTKLSSYIMSPLLIGLMAVAEPFISILLTDKWLPAVPFLRIICIVLLLRAPQTAILQAIKAVGRSDAVLKMDIPIRLFALIILFVSVKYGVIYVAVSEIITTLAATVLYIIVGQRIIGYKAGEVCLDFGINIILSAVMGIGVWLLGKVLVSSNIILILVQIIVGFICYIFLSIVTRNENMIYILQEIRQLIRKRKKN